MQLGIDASNIRDGGGLTHLIELLRVAKPIDYGFSQVIVWGGQKTLNQVEDRPWLVKSYESLLDKALPYRMIWQKFKLSELARTVGCDVLLVLGGSFIGNFQPIVTISQNLLPFEKQELQRYGLSWMTLKLSMLRMTQSSTFRKANGLIFLTQYARDVVTQLTKTIPDKASIIPHGITDRFAHPPRGQRPIKQYSNDQPFRILYVSIIDMYKHQWYVAEAVAKLRKSGFPVVLDLIGPAYPRALKRLRRISGQIDPDGEFIRYLGRVPYTELHKSYAAADLCLFASSCENMPNILLEAMFSGLPIACSDRGPMPDVLGNAGAYFNPENPDDITHTLRELINSPSMRTKLASTSFERVQVYSWTRCARETFKFISEVASKNRDV